MPGFREFLARFRPAGSPGPAVGGAVPADRSAELAAELRPPLTLLDDAAAEAAAIRAAATREAAERRRTAAEQADRIVRTAQARAQDLRRETAARLGQEALAEAARTDARAQHAVRETRQRALERTPGLAARLVDRIAGELTGVRGDGPDAPHRGMPWAPDGSPE